LFTPFKGSVFLEVMGRLRVLALTRGIRVISYGPCSAEIARLGWLKREGDVGGGEGDGGGGERDGGGGEYSLQIFESVGG
jgi:hypothetical protein